MAERRVHVRLGGSEERPPVDRAFLAQGDVGRRLAQHLCVEALLQRTQKKRIEYMHERVFSFEILCQFGRLRFASFWIDFVSRFARCVVGIYRELLVV